MSYQINKEPTKKVPYKDEPKKQLEPQKSEPEAREEIPYQKKKTKTGKRVLQVLFTLVLLGLVGVSAIFAMLPELNSVEVPVDKEALGITENENLTQDEKEELSSKEKDVLNVLLIGVDGEGYDARRSDVMMIMSINKVTKDIKLTSLSRDTMVYLPKKGTYEKLTHAFAYDGPVGTLMTVNQNLDMNIENFVAFDYHALRKLVNAVGGVDVNVDKAEAKEMKHQGTKAPGLGDVVMDGQQALTYARIRHNTGDDPGRNERQREILKSVFERAKKKNLSELLEIAQRIVPSVQTSYTYGKMVEMLEYFETIKSSATLSSGTFPVESEGKIYKGDKLWYVIPKTLKSNVETFHKDIFGLESYTPSDRVEEYSNTIVERTGVE
ncbi:LCP family protein [Guggenheimella bovis]